MYAPHAGLARLRPVQRAGAVAVTLATLIAAVWWLTARLDNGSALSPDAPAAVVLLAVVAAVAGARLAREAFALRRRPASRADADRIGSLAWYVAGVGAIGGTALAALGGALAGLSPVDTATLVWVGAVGSGLAFLPALLHSPGVARTPAARLRRLLDGAGVGLCLMFTGWVLTVTPYGRIDTAHFWLSMLSMCVLSTAVIVGARRIPGRRGHVAGAAGICATVVGLHGLSAVLAHHLPLGWASAAVLLVVTGVALVCWGASALGSPPPGSAAPAREVARRRTCLPVIVPPALAALVVALHQLATGGAFDRAAMMLGTLAALAVGWRQSIIARQAVARLAGHGPRGAAAPAESLVDRPSHEDARRMYERAYADQVTGLANRERLWLSVAAMRGAPRRQGALLAVGIDGITGPDGAAGSNRDAVLLELARRLRAATATEEPASRGTLAARLAGAEFAVLTSKNLVQAYALASALVTALAEPVELGAVTARPGVRIGIADLASAASTDDVLRRAELALRWAQQSGAGRVQWYDATVKEAIERREILERELPDALRRGELVLLYQPIMDLVRSRPVAVEALLRWRHPRLGTLLPEDVIPLAEDVGLMGEVGHWVLGQASAQLATWMREGRDISMAVNISPRELDADELAVEVSAVLAMHGLPPDRLVLELAESGLEDDAALGERVAALRSVGVRTALDEFGAGATSLAHLRTLPIDMVKIGRSFFEDAGPQPSRHGRVPAARTSRDALPLIDVLIGVGRRLGVDVVAHGLEAPAQLELVRTAGCRIGQGHLFARPQPAERTEAYLDRFPAHAR